MKPWQANLGLLTAALIWGGSFVIMDILLDFYTPMQAQFLRNSIAAVILLALNYKKIFKSTKLDLVHGMILGLVYILAMGVQTYGLQSTTVSKNAFFTACYVIFIPIITYILYRTKPNKYLVSGIFIMIIGFFFIIFDINPFDFSTFANLSSQSTFNIGDLLTIVCAFLFAIHIVAVSVYVKQTNPMLLLTYQITFAAVFSGLFIILAKETDLSLPEEKITAILTILYAAIFCTIICFGIQLLFQKYTKASTAGLILSLESPFASIFAVIFGFDPFSVGLVIGGIILMIGIVCAETQFEFFKRNNLK